MSCNIYKVPTSGRLLAVTSNFVFCWLPDVRLWQYTEVTASTVKAGCKLVAKNVKFKH